MTTRKANNENLTGKEAIEKMRKLIDKSGSCFFVTRSDIGAHHSRPMVVQKTDETGSVWFLSALASVKTLELEQDSRVTLYFQGSSYADFLEINGHAVLSNDKNQVEDLWDPTMSAWFPNGKEDPNISVIQFIPESGYYWDNKHGNAIAGIKMLVSAFSGEQPDDQREGKLNP